MKITAITCTYERPEAFDLCKQYLARQTRQPYQWLVLDGPEPMRIKMANAIASGAIQGDAVVIWEDDDHYQPTWIEWCEKKLDRYDIVGEGNAIYYHVGKRWWSECHNTRHASLCNTAIRSELLEPLYNLIQGFDNQFFDTRLWRLEVRRYLSLRTRQVIGIKGMPGRQGYSAEHRQTIPKDVKLDPSLFGLWRLIQNDAANYMKFYQP